MFLDLRLERMSRPLRTIGGVVGGFKARTDLTVGDGPDRLAYRDLTITVIDRMRGPILLGRRPIFRDCVVTFDEGHEMLTLEPGRRVRVRDKVGGEHV